MRLMLSLSERTMWCGIAGGLAIAGSAIAQAPSVDFVTLPQGVLPFGPIGVSDNGQTLLIPAGVSTRDRAFIWTRGSPSPTSPLPIPSTHREGQAFRLSASGTLAAGWVSSPNVLGEPQTSPVRYDSGVPTVLSVPSGFAFAEARGISATGTVLVGTANTSFFPTTARAFKWTNGVASALPLPVGATASTAIDVSNSGVITGGTVYESGLSRATLWTNATPEVLNIPTGYTQSSMISVDASGIGACGWLLTPSIDRQAVVWSPAQTHIIPNLDTRPVEILAVGNLASVGVGATTVGPIEAVIWTRTGGTVRLIDYLTNLGMDTTGMSFSAATDISPDGRFITGYGGFNNQAAVFVITIPNAATGTMLALGLLAAVRRRRTHDRQ